MDFRFTPEQEAFRQEVNGFLQSVLTPDFRRRLHEGGDERLYGGFSQEFSKKLASKGWIGIDWPPEYGGLGKGPMERLIINEALLLHDAPIGYHILGERQTGPSIIRHGTEEQRRELLPKITGADVSFCLGLSEPEAGSDLANVQTRATIDGDHYVINGQKIWMSFGHRADLCGLVVRTDPNVPKHKGISMIIVDMKSPGITIQPLINMAGEHGFNQIFFDNVRVHRRNLLGEENAGWYILAEHLDFERAGIDRIAYNQRLFEECLAFVRQAPRLDSARDALVRHRLADLYVELQMGRLLAYRVAWLLEQDIVPNAEASMSKAFGSEWCQRAAFSVYQIVEWYGRNASAELRERAMYAYLNSVADTIRGGTSEIQRNIIALRGLQMPR